MDVILWIPIAALAIAALTALLARLPAGLHLGVVLGFALGVSVYLYATEYATLRGGFVYLKFLTLAAGILILAVFRFARAGPPAWTRIALYLMLMLNILEAVAFELLDVVIGGPERANGGSVANAAAGFLLMASLAGPGALERREEFQPGQMAGRRADYDLGLAWVLLYALWNFAFVYGTNPPDRPTGEFAGLALVHLAAPLLLMGRTGRQFAEMRILSLYLVMGAMLLAPWPPIVYATPDWHSFAVADALGVTACVGSLALFIVRMLSASQGGHARSPLESLASRLAQR